MAYIRRLTINGVELTMMYQVFFPNNSLFIEMHPIYFITAVTNNWAASIPEFSNSVEKQLVHLKKICTPLGWR